MTTYNDQLFRSTHASQYYRFGIEWLRKGDKRRAFESFKAVLQYQPDHLRATVRVAQLSSDPREQRRFAQRALEMDRYNEDALRLMAELNSASPEEAAESYGEEAPVRRAEESVESQAAFMDCPVCEGPGLYVNDSGLLECRFCGYKAEVEKTPVYARMASQEIHAKAADTHWVVGARGVHCEECGAAWVVNDQALSGKCRYCGSSYVIGGDALDSFLPPNGIVPFRIDKAKAEEILGDALNATSEKLSRLVNERNKVERTELNAVYLPFWVFDNPVPPSAFASLMVLGRESVPLQGDPDRDGAKYHMGVYAVEVPPAAMGDQLGTYNLDDVQGYQPELLVSNPAYLYSVDFDRALLHVKRMIALGMQDQDYHLSPLVIATDIRTLKFWLILLPVWMAVLHEKDGDLRVGLINGQTGKLVLGRAQRPQGKRRG